MNKLHQPTAIRRLGDGDGCDEADTWDKKQLDKVRSDAPENKHDNCW